MAARIEPLIGPNWRQDLVLALDRHRPRVVAISCKWWDTVYGATEVARLVKAHRTATLTVAGGQTASAFAGDLVGRRFFDAVVSGDGEKPLLDFVLGRPEGNVTAWDGEVLKAMPISYVQPAGGQEDLMLLSDMTQIADAGFMRYVGANAPFVWTGKGCQSTCLFCGGSALGHKTLFGRKGYAYRPIEQVIHDMEVLAPFSGGAFMFDFDPVTDPSKRAYYKELLARLPAGRYHAAFYCWSLPDPEFVDLVAGTFASAVIGVDAQTYSDPLRQALARRAWIKPYASNEAIEGILARCAAIPNVSVAMYGIVGLSGETPADVAEAERWLAHLWEAYSDAFFELQITPLSIEPGALMDRDPAKYGMVATRRTLDDYLRFTKLAYERDSGFHEAPFGPDLPHPYGVHQATDAPDRVWNDFRRLREALDGRGKGKANRNAYEALKLESGAITLKLENRTAFEDDWRLIAWAADEALARGIGRVEVEARSAHIVVPDQATLAYDERNRWLAVFLDVLREAIAGNKVEVAIDGAPGQHWGAFAEAGARLTSSG